MTKYYTLGILLLLSSYVKAQTIHLIPNPNANPIGYTGSPIVYNNKLYIQYKVFPSGTQLAEYNGTSISLIPNPDKVGDRAGYMGSPIVYNNKLYIQYKNSQGIYQLGQFDGRSLTLIDNPNKGNGIRGYLGLPIVYNNKLFGQYDNQLGQYDGSSSILVDRGYTDSPLLYNGKLYFGAGSHLVEYDGTKFISIYGPNQKSIEYGGYPVIYHNKLYVECSLVNGANTQLGVYDGAAITPIENPDSGQGYINAPIVYDDNLYFFYRNQTNEIQLAQFNGATVKLIPNPDIKIYKYQIPTPGIVCNKKLYFELFNAEKTVFNLVEFDGNKYRVIPNPDQGGQYVDYPFVYNNKLYFRYFSGGQYQLAQYDGIKFKLIDDTKGQYMGNPVIYDNKLYLCYQNGISLKLAYLTER